MKERIAILKPKKKGYVSPLKKATERISRELQDSGFEVEKVTRREKTKVNFVPKIKK